MSSYYQRIAWTPEQDAYIRANRNHQTCQEMAAALDIPNNHVRSRLQTLRRLDANQPTAVPNGTTAEGAAHWAGGRYWLLPPKKTWHRGITGRLIHHSATADDDLPLPDTP